MSETMVVARAEGPYIYDKQGKRYLEGMAGLWCTALGYGNEEVIGAAERQMRELSFSHMFGGKTHLPLNSPISWRRWCRCRMVESSWATQDLMPTTHS